MPSKRYDFLVFGVTGFTGKLVVEYLLTKDYGVKWATCARNKAKAQSVLSGIAESCGTKDPPEIYEADLVCTTDEQKENLRSIVQQTKVVLTCAGPFEKYGTDLVQICAEEGVHYGDITGETDFVRKMVHQHDATARKSGACIISHCGNDCIPQDLMVYELNAKAKEQNCVLQSVETFVEFPSSATFSGGTVATAAFQLTKDRTKKSTEFDPMLMSSDGTKSNFVTKNISPKSKVWREEVKANVAPWIMAPVMVNCVRRSNALLAYNEQLVYGDSQVQNLTWSSWLSNTIKTAQLSAAIVVPTLRTLLVPQPGQGPDRETMEAGYMTLYSQATMKEADSDNTKKMKGKFHFGKDIGYLYTAALLVETGMVLLDPASPNSAGVVTPAAGLGHALTERILDKMEVSLEIELV